jgi:hypothetical protein
LWAPSSICREVARNRRNHDGGYCAFSACERALAAQ